MTLTLVVSPYSRPIETETPQQSYQKSRNRSIALRLVTVAANHIRRNHVNAKIKGRPPTHPAALAAPLQMNLPMKMSPETTKAGDRIPS